VFDRRGPPAPPQVGSTCTFRILQKCERIHVPPRTRRACAPACANGRFLSGNTGNRSARKKGSGGPLTRLTPPLRRRVSVDVSGKKRRLNIVIAALRKLGDRAANGDPAAVRELLRIARERKAAALAEAHIEEVTEAPQVVYRNAPHFYAPWRLGVLTGTNKGWENAKVRRWVGDAAFARWPELSKQESAMLACVDAALEGEETARDKL